MSKGYTRRKMRWLCDVEASGARTEIGKDGQREGRLEMKAFVANRNLPLSDISCIFVCTHHDISLASALMSISLSLDES